MRMRTRGESLEEVQDKTDIWLKQSRCSERGKGEMMADVKAVAKVVYWAGQWGWWGKKKVDERGDARVVQ